MSKKESIEKLVAEVLDGTEMRFAVDSYSLEEDLEASRAVIRCAVHDTHTGEKKVIEGRGVGIVDAFFHGLVDLFSGQYPSLNTIRFSDFAIKADLDSGRGSRSDSNAEITLRVANSDDVEYAFKDVSPSITRSALNTVLHGVEFFINSERAFISVYKALQHARQAGRHDSVERYTAQLTTLVQATSYSEVIEQIRSELKSK